MVSIDDILADRRNVRRANMVSLAKVGLAPAEWLPLREHRCVIRPTSEIVDRLMAVGALHGFIADDESEETAALLASHIDRSDLSHALTPAELAALRLPRAEARSELGLEAPILLDFAWPLAWALGFSVEPDAKGRPLDASDRKSLLWFCQRGFDSTRDVVTEGAKLRPLQDIVAVEDLFFCAENAVTMRELTALARRAGSDGALDPETMRRADAIRARRHALTFLVSPGVSWDDVEGTMAPDPDAGSSG